MGWTKLDSGIVSSSLWSEPADIRIVWITLLALCDENGYVGISEPGLSRMANVSDEITRKALELFMSPDDKSRTPDNEGRRLMKSDNGGFIILNHLKYRERIDRSYRREQVREAVRRFREKGKICNQSVISGNQMKSSVITEIKSNHFCTASVSVSESVSEEVKNLNIPEVPKETKRRKRSVKEFVPPTKVEAVAYFTENGFGNKGEEFYNYYAVADWHDKNGDPVRNWKQKAQVWFKNNKGDVQNAPIQSGYDAMVAKYGVGKGYEPETSLEVLEAPVDVFVGGVGDEVEFAGFGQDYVAPVVEKEEDDVWGGVVDAGDDINGITESGIW